MKNTLLPCFYSIEKDHLTLQANVRADLVAFLVINEQTAPARNLSVKQVTPGCLLLNFQLAMQVKNRCGSFLV